MTSASSGSNQAVTTQNKLDLGGVDEIAALAKEFLRLGRPGSPVAVRSRDGLLEGAGPSPAWPSGGLLALGGRTLDLKSAYKQLARHPADAAVSVLAVWRPKGDGYDLFLSRALPFGAVASVYAFNRVARGLKRVAQRLLRLAVTNYFDDFPQVEPAALWPSAQESLLRLFELLGWRVAVEEKKNRPFASSFHVLGVAVDFSGSHGGAVLIRNKEDRVTELLESVAVAKSRGLSFAKAASLRGRFQYAESQTFGRCASAALAVLGSRTALVRFQGGASFELTAALEWLAAFVQNARPREVRAFHEKPPCLVFTDGACEGDVVTCGGVIFTGDIASPCWFGLRISSKVVRSWRRFGPQHVVAQAELLPVLIARRTWCHFLTDAPAVFYVDNEGVREALVKGSTASLASREMLLEVAGVAAEQGGIPWYILTGRLPQQRGRRPITSKGPS